MGLLDVIGLLMLLDQWFNYVITELIQISLDFTEGMFLGLFEPLTIVDQFVCSFAL